MVMKKNEDKMKQNLEVVKRFLMQYELTLFGNEEAGLIIVCFKDMVITFQVSEDLLDIEVSSRKEVPEKDYPEAVSYLNMANYFLKEGHLEMNQKQEVSFRITSKVGPETILQTSQLEELLDKANGIGLWIEGRSKIVEEGLGAEEALKEVLHGRFEQMWAELLNE